jgi:RimJ/RimL family protein N-acetyltransferase
MPRGRESVSLRPARAADRDMLLAWRNDPAVREASRTTAEVSPEEHAAWFARRMSDPDTRIFVVEDGGEAAGQIRVDRLAGSRGEIHVALAEAMRGRRLAAPALAMAARQAAQQLGLASVEANVRAANEPSLRAFARAGFTETERDGDWVALEWTAP